MTNSPTEITAYWQAFLQSLPADSPYHNKPYGAEGFGDNPTLADRLGELVVQGIKTATCSAVWAWEADDDPLPEVGDVWMVLDGQGHPMCITETTGVTIRPYNEVDATFAYEEGEGDRSLDYWCKAHRNYFSRTLSDVGREFSDTMPLVCERFRVIYR